MAIFEEFSARKRLKKNLMQKRPKILSALCYDQ